MRLKQTETNQTQITPTVAFPSSIVYYTPFPYRTIALYPFGSSCEQQSTLHLPHPSHSQVLERNAIRVRVQIIIRHTQLHLASPQTRLRTHSSRNASQRASVVGLRGSFANSLPLDGTTPPDSHMPSLPSANSILFPAKASGSMQYLRIPAGTSPIHTDCVRALPPLRLAATNRWAADCRSCLSPLPRGSTRSTGGHLRRTCPQDARCRRWARLRGALPRLCWPILWKGKAEFPSSEPTPNQDGGLAAEPTRGEDASCTARCRFERDARGSRWDVLESGEKEECVWFTRRYRFLVGWYFPTRLITRSEFPMLA